ncbi:hypothetical protein BFS14_19650 [Serratia fonticola]|nr:hypothetical protein BFS14_19650 [Serratia fonticola]
MFHNMDVGVWSYRREYENDRADQRLGFLLLAASYSASRRANNALSSPVCWYLGVVHPTCECIAFLLQPFEVGFHLDEATRHFL